MYLLEQLGGDLLELSCQFWAGLWTSWSTYNEVANIPAGIESIEASDALQGRLDTSRGSWQEAYEMAIISYWAGTHLFDERRLQSAEVRLRATYL